MAASHQGMYPKSTPDVFGRSVSPKVEPTRPAADAEGSGARDAAGPSNSEPKSATPGDWGVHVDPG